MSERGGIYKGPDVDGTHMSKAREVKHAELMQEHRDLNLYFHVAYGSDAECLFSAHATTQNQWRVPMIDYNPARDRWQSRYLELSARATRVIDVIIRKAMLPPPEDQSGTFVCPYCYHDDPHSALSHDHIADAFELEADEPQREFLRLIARRCREHGERAELGGTK